LATVSSPVYASIASGNAKMIWCQVGCVPIEIPRVSALPEKRNAKPSATSISWVERSSTATKIP